MAKVEKKVDRAVPVNKRTQVFTQADAGSGDILMINSSLGKSATHLRVEAIADMTVKFNVIRKVYPKRSYEPLFNGSPEINVALGKEIIGNSMGEVILSAGETYEVDNEFVIDDISIESASGNFIIFVS